MEVVDHSSKAVPINIAPGHSEKRDTLYNHISSSISILPAAGLDSLWSIGE
jgi:hypothetical protein